MSVFFVLCLFMECGKVALLRRYTRATIILIFKRCVWHCSRKVGLSRYDNGLLLDLRSALFFIMYRLYCFAIRVPYAPPRRIIERLSFFCAFIFARVCWFHQLCVSWCDALWASSQHHTSPHIARRYTRATIILIFKRCVWHCSLNRSWADIMMIYCSTFGLRCFL